MHDDLEAVASELTRDVDDVAFVAPESDDRRHVGQIVSAAVAERRRVIVVGSPDANRDALPAHRVSGSSDGAAGALGVGAGAGVDGGSTAGGSVVVVLDGTGGLVTSTVLVVVLGAGVVGVSVVVGAALVLVLGSVLVVGGSVVVLDVEVLVLVLDVVDGGSSQSP